MSISVSRSGPIQIIRIDRPDKKNAITLAMYNALVAAFEEGDKADDVRAHVVLGHKGVFSAGNDIGDFLAHGSGPGISVETILRFLDKLPKIAKPVVAGVDGAAIGVGVTMLMHFDLVYASPQSVFSTPFLDLGLVPEAGSSLLMPRTFGHQRAFEMLVLGAPFSAERAREAGLVNEIVASESLEEKVIGIANRLASKPPEALALARRLVKGDTTDIAARMAQEAKHFKAQLASPEAREAFEAFLQKRKPDFSKVARKG